MVQIKCSCCNNDVEQHKTVSCCICKQLFNYSCVKLTQSEARAINTNKNLSWTCSKCIPLGADIAALKEVVISLQKEIYELKNQRTVYNTSNFEFEEVLHELHEREKRKNNIIIYGVKEETNQNREERQALVQQNVQNIFNAMPMNMEPVKVTRVGVFDPSKSRPRPIRVTLKDEYSVHRVLKQKKGLKNNDQFKNVSIYTDRTPKQIEFFRKLKLELERRKDEGELNLHIKYVKGVPKITTLN